MKVKFDLEGIGMLMAMLALLLVGYALGQQGGGTVNNSTLERAMK